MDPLVIWLVPGKAAVSGKPVSVDAPVERRPSGLGRLALCHGLFGFGYVVTATFLIAVGRASSEAQMLEPLVGLTGLPSMAAWGWASIRYGPRRAFALTTVGFGVGRLPGR